jgi:threonine dehydrogenase-like Zn-dependent dehydrogenase
MTASNSLPATSKAAVIVEPYKIVVKDVPTPQIKEDNDAIIKNTASGLCGSDLHIYRGHQPGPYNYVIGHEAVGTVAAVGPGVKKFKVGDKVVAPFATTCGRCYYCKQGYTSRCNGGGQLLGSAANPGAQAEYVRIPEAEASLSHAPDDIPEQLLLLMADILPTGYSAAYNARHLLDDHQVPQAADFQVGAVKQPEGKRGVAVVIGCGPVGLCAITSALSMFEKVFATDLAPHRLKQAEKHGAIALQGEELKKAVLEATEGRGADAAIEVVGHQSALDTGIDLLRPWGVLSSCGLHTHDVTIPGLTLYGKNLRLQFGRCSVPTFTPAALEILRQNQSLFADFIEHEVPLEKAPEYYKEFEQNKIGKTVFVF